MSNLLQITPLFTTITVPASTTFIDEIKQNPQDIKAFYSRIVGKFKNKTEIHLGLINIKQNISVSGHQF